MRIRSIQSFPFKSGTEVRQIGVNKHKWPHWGKAYSEACFFAFAVIFLSLANDFRFKRLIRKASASRLVSAADRGVRGLFAMQ
jgi:hypothetical protein